MAGLYLGHFAEELRQVDALHVHPTQRPLAVTSCSLQGLSSVRGGCEDVEDHWQLVTHSGEQTSERVSQSA